MRRDKRKRREEKQGVNKMVLPTERVRWSGFIEAFAECFGRAADVGIRCQKPALGKPTRRARAENELPGRVGAEAGRRAVRWH